MNNEEIIRKLQFLIDDNNELRNRITSLEKELSKLLFNLKVKW